ncbi:hypothetical protein DH2020_035304 [Rehmannia glutinosa]|uniref:Myb/SANT-like domain-containing protein n=1 Tax=Rehmannia glutinosa TaxID=99300 RepID=A0ABR0V7K1_REHGL
MKYTFVLSGWEGSAADNRVLRDAVTRPNGLRVPTGNYYLCDCGYTNGPGFLAPYRGIMESTASVGKGATSRSVRHSWISQEESVLLHALKELVAQGYKCDNGLKAGYQHLLERSLFQAFPGTELRAEPHIASKLTVWKKKYASICMMMRKSGFGWDDSNNQIIVKEDAIWNDYVNTDANANTMRYKSWPMYKEWCDIFGKDRATGENAEVFHDVIQEILNGGQPNDARREPEQIPVTPNSQFQPDTTSEVRGESSTTNKNNRNKKRKTNDAMEDRFLDLMASFCEKANNRLGDLAQRIGFDQDTRQQLKVVFDALSEMSFLSVEDNLAITKQLCNNAQDLDMFFSLTDEYKGKMVKMMRDGRL